MSFFFFCIRLPPLSTLFPYTTLFRSTPSFGYDGKRNWSESEFMGLQPNWLGLLMNTSATGLGGDCYGDSGGPKFLETDPGVIYATVTTGDYVCRATSWDFRTDTPTARAFLGQFVALPSGK